MDRGGQYAGGPYPWAKGTAEKRSPSSSGRQKMRVSSARTILKPSAYSQFGNSSPSILPQINSARTLTSYCLPKMTSPSILTHAPCEFGNRTSGVVCFALSLAKSTSAAAPLDIGRGARLR